MICKIPCCECEKYFTCREVFKKNRCNNCIYAKINIYKSPCLKCKGLDLINKHKEDYFKKK